MQHNINYTVMRDRYSLLRGYFRGTLWSIQEAKNKEELNKIVDKALAFLDKLDSEKESEITESER